MQDAEAAAAPPDPALHERQVADLDAACRDSLSRIASLQNEIRYVRWACCVCPLAGMSASERPVGGRGRLVTLQLSCVICTDLEEQQGELRERRNSTEATAAAEMRRIRQTDPKLR